MGYAKGTRWSEELIEKNILSVMETLEIKRMPSNSEIVKVTGNSMLSNAIRRHGGFYSWATKLNIPVKESETYTGNWGEKEVCKMLENLGYKAERMSTRYPYDILADGCLKIDVKVSNKFYYDEKGYYYTFNLEKKYPTCDLYICLCLDKGEIVKTLIIPSKLTPKSQLSIGIDSRYDKYIDRWDYIEKYRGFYDGI